MEVYKDLIGRIETALDQYQYEKYGHIELDDETSQGIFNECKRFLEHIKEDIEDLDATIDEYIEDMNQPSNYEFDCREDDKRHYENITGR